MWNKQVPGKKKKQKNEINKNYQPAFTPHISLHLHMLAENNKHTTKSRFPKSFMPLANGSFEPV